MGGSADRSVFVYSGGPGDRLGAGVQASCLHELVWVSCDGGHVAGWYFLLCLVLGVSFD